LHHGQPSFPIGHVLFLTHRIDVPSLELYAATLAIWNMFQTDLGIRSVYGIERNRCSKLNSMVVVVKAAQQRIKQFPWQRQLVIGDI